MKIPYILNKPHKIALLSLSIAASFGSAIGATIQIEGPYPYSAASNTGTRGINETADAQGTRGEAGYIFLTDPESVASDNRVTVASGVIITGGAGGNGYNDAGVGILGSNLTLENDGRITGGAGGYGGSARSGSGGAGVSGDSLTIINRGQITGGSGSYGQSNIGSTDGLGGAGISGNHLTITNIVGGTITGGEGHYGGNSAAGISVNDSTITNGGRIIGARGSYGYGNGSGLGGVAGDGISGNRLTIDNIASGSITGGEGNSRNAGGAGISGDDLRITNGGSITGGEGGFGYGNDAGMAGAGISGNGMTIINSGRITGGKGGYGGLDDNGGAGNPTAGAAGIFGSNAVITNSGSIIGGEGGFAGGDSSGPDGSDGGDGISGSHMSITNMANGSITGGNGKYGGGYTANALGGNGGHGGSGISGSDMTITNDGRITGGNGSYNGPGSEALNGGNGGAGVTGSDIEVINRGVITGGNGERGNIMGVSGEGGAGVSGNNRKITNTGSITGGVGYDARYYNYYGGNGGAGISGSNRVIENSGSIVGGRGGSSNIGSGNGGAGISGSDLTIVNSGQITGGSGGTGANSGENGSAIDLTGGSNTLTLDTGSVITGNITLADSTAEGATALLIVGRVAENRAINGGLAVGRLASVALAGQPIEFSGQVSFAEGTALTLGAGVSLKADSLSIEEGASLNANITHWDQHDIMLVETVNGISGAFSFNNALVAGMSQPDFAYINAGDRTIKYSLYWNGLDSDAHGTFTLDEGRTFSLGVDLADNTVHTNTLWDGKSLTKAGKGTLVLSVENTYTGSTHIHEGTLKTTASNAFANTSGVTIDEGGTLNLNGNSQTVNTLDNGGTLLIDDYGVPPASPLSVTLTGDVTNSGNIVLNNSDTSAGNTLTIDGDYVGNGGSLSLGTVLGGDSSLTDKLVVTGSATGTTYVSVSNENGSGSLVHEGIKIVETGSTTSDAFVQRGRIVAGSYEYYVKQGTASGEDLNSWYLTSLIHSPNPDESGNSNDSVHVYRPEGGSYTSNLAAANSLFSTRLHDRQGSAGYFHPVTGGSYETSMWLRVSGGHSAGRMSDGQNKTSANRFVIQLGGDLAQGSVNGVDSYHLGIMGGYGKQNSNTHNRWSGHRSRGEVSGYSAGLYGTWYQNSLEKTGLYVDSWVLYNWFDNTVKGNELAQESYNSKGITSSVESGYTYHIGSYATDSNIENKVYIRPQAQVIWAGVKADDHIEKNGTRVKGEGNDNIQTRLGVRLYLNGKSRVDKDTVREFQPFVETNWVHNSKQYGVQMKDTRSYSEGSRNVYEAKVGIEGRLSKGFSVWSHVAQQVGKNGYHDTSGVVGVNYRF